MEGYLGPLCQIAGGFKAVSPNPEGRGIGPNPGSLPSLHWGHNSNVEEACEPHLLLNRIMAIRVMMR
jgi:hypothetical protein